MNELPSPAVPLLFKVVLSGMQVMAIASHYDLRWPGFLDELNKTVWDAVDDSAEFGLRATTANEELALELEQGSVHAGIDLNNKDSSEAHTAYARQTVGKRMRRRRNNVFLRTTEITNDPQSPSNQGPLAPPIAPPTPSGSPHSSEPSGSRTSTSATNTRRIIKCANLLLLQELQGLVAVSLVQLLNQLLRPQNPLKTRFSRVRNLTLVIHARNVGFR